MTGRATIGPALLLATVMCSPAAAEPTMPGCTYEVGALSVEHMASDGSPVLFQWFDCNGRFVKRYIDFTGRELAEGSLVPAVRYRIVDYLEELLGVDIDMSPEIEQLEAIATERGLI